MTLDAKYPRTPHWPYSPSIGRDEGVHPDPDRFVGESVVVTEKLDGGNTLLHAGRVYARSVSAPSEGPWMAMVKKHHAWKVNEPDVWLYGEDIYGVHSIEYGAVAESRTFYAFALRGRDGTFASFSELEAYARQREIPVVPVLFRGCCDSVGELRGLVKNAHAEPSALGGAREGVVLRLARGFPASELRSTSARASAPATCSPTTTGRGTGGRAGLRASPDEACRVPKGDQGHAEWRRSGIGTLRKDASG